MDALPYKVTLEFGTDEEARGQTRTTYEFATEAELDAFMAGAAAVEGWLEYHVIEEAEDGLAAVVQSDGGD